MDNIAKLEAYLPLSLWGINEAKTFPQLIAEIEAGESQILWDGQKPIRRIRVARVDVLSIGQYLREIKQILADGRIRIRNIRGISEKLHANESFLEGAVRGIREELGLTLPAELFKYIGENHEVKESSSYPGLETQYLFGNFSLNLPVELCLSEFIADEGDSTTYFGWTK